MSNKYGQVYQAYDIVTIVSLLSDYQALTCQNLNDIAGMTLAPMSGMARNITYIQRQLRAGKTPESLGAIICGQGVQKAAYRIPGSIYVIKEMSDGGYRDGSDKPPKGIKKYGARAAIKFRAGKWSFQEYVTPICKLSYEERDSHSDALKRHRDMYNSDLGDLHEGNVGIAKNGDLVVFDW